MLERQTDYRLRLGGGLAAFFIAFLTISAIVGLGYQGHATTVLVMGLGALTAVALGVGGAILTGQKVTVKEVTQGTAEVVRALQGKKTPEDKESENE